MDIEAFKDKYEHKKVIENTNSVAKNPLVSVCIQTYQHEDYIKECLDSIIIQKTDFQFEVLLGEDASDDNTRAICISYAKRYPNKIRLFLHHRENNISIDGSPSGRFNFLYNLHNAKGKYIALCDGDDYWTDTLKLQKQVDFLEKNKDFGLVHTNFDYLKDGIKGNNKSRKLLIPKGNVKEALLRENFIATLTVCFNKEKFDLAHNKIFEKYLMGDYPAWMALALNSKIGYLGDSTAVYRYLENSASHSDNKLKQFDFIKSTFKMKFYFIDNYQFNKETIKKVNESYCKYLFKYAVLLNESNIIDEFKSFTKNKISSKIKIYKFFFMFRKVRLLKKFIIIFTNK